ncbi:MAG TPA: hypothetical protein VFU31_25000, partial [Candidatus Binatia bacterium]|nr:hypothetical protein [Candidatus Binatia bacterium]
MPKPAPADLPRRAPPAEIPLADIAARATEVSNLLGTLTAAAAPSTQIESIAKSLPDLSDKLDAQSAATTATLEAEPTLETLQTLQQQWQRTQLETTGWLSALTRQATKLQDGLNQLAELQKTWNNTRDSALASKAPDPILQQIDATLTAMAGAQAKLQTERSAVLDLQSRLAQEVTKCGTALAQIGQHQHKAVAGIFVPDSPPIWKFELWADALNALPEHVRKVGIAQWSDLAKYFGEPRQGVALHTTLLVVLALIFTAARRKVDGWNKSSVPVSAALSVFERPYAAALAAVLVLVTSPFFQTPNTVRQSLMIVALAPMIRLVRPIVSHSVAFAIYGFCVLFAIDILRQAFAGIQIIGQAIIVAETLAAILALFWLRRHYRQFMAERAESSRLILFRLGRFIFLIVLVVALFAGV